MSSCSCRQLGVLRGDRAAEEGDRAVPLMKNSAKSRAGCITVDDEGLVEVRQLKNRRRRERPFERVEGFRRRRGPQERLPYEEGCERCRNDAVIVDEGNFG